MNLNPKSQMMKMTGQVILAGSRPSFSYAASFSFCFCHHFCGCLLHRQMGLKVVLKVASLTDVRDRRQDVMIPKNLLEFHLLVHPDSLRHRFVHHLTAEAVS